MGGGINWLSKRLFNLILLSPILDLAYKLDLHVCQTPSKCRLMATCFSSPYDFLESSRSSFTLLRHVTLKRITRQLSEAKISFHGTIHYVVVTLSQCLTYSLQFLPSANPLRNVVPTYSRMATRLSKDSSKSAGATKTHLRLCGAPGTEVVSGSIYFRRTPRGFALDLVIGSCHFCKNFMAFAPASPVKLFCRLNVDRFTL